MEDYKSAGIPYARNHDASGTYSYGYCHVVDVNFIFPDFSADPYDKQSYDFILTDELMRITESAGTKTFYRLGSQIEHWSKKYNTLPPKDFKKWAIVCEHIIRHYVCGWADGFHYDIEYWEIWNEPDMASGATWGGTVEQFCELFNITCKHLKSQFPKLKIGGPAVCWYKDWWMEKFLGSLEIKPDFISWHCYAHDVSVVVNDAKKYRQIMDRYGLQNAESILNEWNYVSKWDGEGFKYTIRQIMGLKGAAYTGAVMAACQNQPVDMLMYYDARPCSFNGMWSAYTLDRLKGYYPFVAFNTLYRLGQNVMVSSNAENLYLCAARNEKEAAVMIVHFDDDDAGGSVEFYLDMVGLPENTMAEYYLLDENHDLELVRKRDCVNAEQLELPHNGLLLIKLSADA